MLTRRIVVVAVVGFLFCTTISSNAQAAPFLPGDVLTWSQDRWGDLTHPASTLITDHFTGVYMATGVLEVGIPGPGGFSMGFTGASPVLDYLPSVGGVAPLDADLVDPTSSGSGAFGGEVVSLQLNVDFSDAGHLTGTLGIPFGDLIIQDYAAIPAVNGLTVRQFLADANVLLGGGSLSYSLASAYQLTVALNASFVDGGVSLFAQDNLRVAAQPVPEPGALSLLGVAVAALTMRRFRQKR